MSSQGWPLSEQGPGTLNASRKACVAVHGSNENCVRWMFEQLGRYQIQELIGEGSMAEVYKAYDPKIGRTLAVKVLKPEWCVDEDYLGRFMREAKAAGAFSHPNIVTVYDVGQIDDRPYIVIELIDGTPLGDSIKPGTPMPLDRVLAIGIQLADALHYAHERGVVHRDVKPNNILLLPDGKTIKIADFGIAHMDDPDAAQKTQVGTVLGTPQYMSPEQVMGQKVDGRSDLFSVGVILYLLCTGQKPFDSNTMATLLFKITQEEPPPIFDVAPNLPAGLQHIINKLISKAPERRFQSGHDLARALRRELKAIEELAESGERPRIISLRVRWALLSTSIVAVTMGVAIYFIEAKQKEELTGFAIDSGVSLAKFIATETAVPVLGGEWVAMEIFVDETVRGQSFEYLSVLDHEGVIRASSDPAQIGESYVRPGSATRMYDGDGVVVSEVGRMGGTPVLEFDAPILFQDKEVGRVHLGVVQTSLRAVADTTRTLFVILGAMTVLTVGLVSFGLAQLLSRPVRTLRASLKEISKGNYDCRISENRNDELGLVFAEFNHMAEALGGHNEPYAKTPEE